MSIETIIRSIPSVKKGGLYGIKLSLSEMILISEEYNAAESAVEQANQAVLEASETIQKLVAENAAYKSSEIMEFLRLVECMTGDYNDSNHGNAQEWIRHISKASSDFEDKHGDTPWGRMKGLATIDTYAAIAEIGAKAIDMFAAWQKDLALQSQGDIRHAYVGSVHDANKFAANLRAGRKG